jgi:hypothetical protein
VTFTNTTGAPATGVKLSISVPGKQWTSVVPGTTETSKTFADPVAPGASVSATFKVTSGPAAFNGDLVGNASWTNANGRRNPRQRRPRRCGTSARSRSTSSASAPVLPPTRRTRSSSSTTPAPERRHLQLDPDRAPDPAGHLLVGEDPGRDEARGRRLLPARPLQLRAGGPARAGDTTIYVRSTTGMNGRRYDQHRHRLRRGDPQDRQHRDGGRQQYDAVATPPRRSGDHDPRRLDQRACHERGRLRGRREDRHRLWRHLPRRRKSVEKYEVATVTAVGKPGTQAFLGRTRPPATPTSR